MAEVSQHGPDEPIRRGLVGAGTVVTGRQFRALRIMEADGPDVGHAVVHRDRGRRRPDIGPRAASAPRLPVGQVLLHRHGGAVEPQGDGDGSVRHVLGLPHAALDLRRHLRGRRAHGFGDPFQRTARRRAAMIGRHVLLGTAHMVFRVPQHDPQPQGRRRPLHHARLEVQRHNGRPVVHPHRAVRPPLEVHRPTQAVVPHGPRLVALVHETVDLHVGPVVVTDRLEIPGQKEARRIVRQSQGRRLTLLERGVATHPRIDRTFQHVGQGLPGDGPRIAFGRKLLHCTHDASF